MNRKSLRKLYDFIKKLFVSSSRKTDRKSSETDSEKLDAGVTDSNQNADDNKVQPEFEESNSSEALSDSRRWKKRLT